MLVLAVKRASTRPPVGGGGRPPSSAATKENNAATTNSTRPGISRTVTASSSSRPAANSAAAAKRYEERIASLTARLDEATAGRDAAERTAAEAEMNLGTIESERDFYFEKLRGIEVMLQVYREREEEEKGSGDVEGVMHKIFTVMYATMEDNVLVDDDGNVSLLFSSFFSNITLCSRNLNNSTTMHNNAQLLGDAGAAVDSSISVDDGDFARAQDHDPEADGAAAKEAGAAVVGSADADDDDYELLISPAAASGGGKCDDAAATSAAVPDQFSDDSDGELLTDGLDGDDGGAGASPPGPAGPALVVDDDDIPDDDLLADD